jgi:hypothetical protein
LTREQAIAKIEHSRDTHIAWINYFGACPYGGPGKCQECTDRAEVAGGPEHHKQVVKDYTGVLSFLRTA